MNKKLGRLFWPGLWVFFLVLSGFVAAALFLSQYILAAVEGGIAILLAVYYVICRTRRRREIQSYVDAALGSAEVNSGTQTPFPMVLVRMGDKSVLWANEEFSAITGYQERYLEQQLGTVLPNFSLDWLSSGKRPNLEITSK